MPNALITGITGQDGSYLAELLLEKGYDVDVFKLLLRNGANPDVPGKDGRTVRQIAAVSGIAAGAEHRVLREHPALDRGQMPHHIAERELPFLVCPVDAVGRDAARHAHRPGRGVAERVT